MSGKSKIDIFKNMTLDELNTEINKHNISQRIYQRLIAMKLISEGHTLKDTGEILGVTYATINRWVNMCEKGGLEGLKPNFKGGRPSYLTDEEKIILDEMIQRTPNMVLIDVHNLILEKFNVDYSMKQVWVIVKQLGYNYSKNLS